MEDLEISSMATAEYPRNLGYDHSRISPRPRIRTSQDGRLRNFGHDQNDPPPPRI